MQIHERNTAALTNATVSNCPELYKYQTDRRGEYPINSQQRLEQYIKQYQNPIFSICYRLTGDYFEAEDLTQDTFLSAYKNLAFFDGNNERAWLCKIATNKCIDHLKRAGRRSVPTQDSFFTAITDNQTSPLDHCLAQDLKKELYECCSRLKTPYREVAIDYFHKEMTISEIAEKTGKNIKTLQTQLYRAKAMLKKQYRKEDLKDG